MAKGIGLVANLQLCMGCLACEVACRQKNDREGDGRGIQVFTLGPYEVNGELCMDFVPLASNECDLCESCRTAGEDPFCAEICPTQALEVYTEEEILRFLRSSDRFHICKMKK